MKLRFDDGDKDNLYNAASILLDFNISFTVFVSQARIRSNDEKYLITSELPELPSMQSVSIGVHGMTHMSLTAKNEKFPLCMIWKYETISDLFEIVYH